MTQNEMILTHLQENGEITPLDAMREFGCMRLSARIADLRAQGYEIESNVKTTRNRYGHCTNYAVYSLKRNA